MKIYRHSIWILLFALASHILLRSIPISIENDKDVYPEKASFSAIPYYFGDAEHTANGSLPTSGGNTIVFAKLKSQTGFSHHHCLSVTPSKNPEISNIIIVNSSSKTLLRFFSSSWYQVFGLRKIII
jgi:hypothetical protein